MGSPKSAPASSGTYCSKFEQYKAGSKRVGLVIVDEVNGFATVGAGSCAPLRLSPQIDKMIDETDRLARHFLDRGWPVLAFMDRHEVGVLEPPWPRHCERGSGEEEFVPRLRWLDNTKCAKIYKNCADGFLGAFRKDGSNDFAKWVKENAVEHILVVGTCTDVCVLDFVVSALSARNHGMVPPLSEVFVYTEGCATSDLTREEAEKEGTTPHPQGPTHHIGLYVMLIRGAKLVNAVRFEDMISAFRQEMREGIRGMEEDDDDSQRVTRLSLDDGGALPKQASGAPQEDVQKAALAAIEGVWNQLKHADSTMRRIHETQDVSEGYRHYLDVMKEPGGQTFDYEDAPPEEFKKRLNIFAGWIPFLVEQLKDDKIKFLGAPPFMDYCGDYDICCFSQEEHAH
ncbi:hypothetical protein KFL_006440050 [Klebsormidium nitens]|uniref:Isochorismatase-like domain-containing protein n=1 Tax=Klebsormidium nitens TaxID=105231 RepID=A0A1Y1IQR4_KLENI|nr:hypothetical protein KFL_006440050 [Klebsormidium nitens]|eukprot:GAQ90478.1 hypothetical protein KFL_006440050 [Klebsormidium nitens]